VEEAMSVVSVHEDLQEKLDDAGLVISHLVTPENPIRQKNQASEYAEPHEWNTPEKKFVPVGTIRNTGYRYLPRSSGRRWNDYLEPAYAKVQARERIARERADAFVEAIYEEDRAKTARAEEFIKCEHCLGKVKRKNMTRHILERHRRR
jgi:hypothetical protein